MICNAIIKHNRCSLCVLFVVSASFHFHLRNTNSAPNPNPRAGAEVEGIEMLAWKALRIESATVVATQQSTKRDMSAAAISFYLAGPTEHTSKQKQAEKHLSREA